MKLVLIGSCDDKRTEYMKKAAGQLGAELVQVGWDSLEDVSVKAQCSECVVKLDPPSFQTSDFLEMKSELEQYQMRLKMLGQMDCRFLNTPEAVATLLDKRAVKLKLQENHVAVTWMFEEWVQTTRELIALMEQKHCYSVFVKPRFFSGAAGVAAIHFHPVKKEMVMLTSCLLEKGKLANTRRIRRYTDYREIEQLLDVLLSLDCIVERWHPKAEHNKKTYDLRVVYQFGHVAFTVVRQSSSPITNLHLNNQAADVNELNLPVSVWEEIEALSRQAVELFDGLSMAGIDIMLDKKTKKPRIIEMNGQGDLIYQDIFSENRIYREQISTLLGL